jgi:serine/threonine protein kinase
MRSTSIPVKRPGAAEAVDEFAAFHALPDRMLSGRFRLLRRIGEGALSKVFLAADQQTGERVAIKALKEKYAPSPKLRKVLETEAEALTRACHPGVVRLMHRSGTPPYLALELLDGVPPKRLDLDAKMVVALASEACAILSAVHSAGVVHRDIKTENMLIVHGSLKLMDFDYAKIFGTWDYATVAGHPVGTAEYMAPEQARNAGDAVPASDLYSLGVVMYELLSGSLPFEDDEPERVLKMHRFDDPPRLVPRRSVPEGLVGLVSRAMAKKPEDRFRDAAHMGSELVSIRRAFRDGPDLED